MSKSSEAVKRWRNNNKDRMVTAMGGKCQGCGYNTCNSALAFHHIDPTEKDLVFGKSRANPVNWNKFVSELRKCILLCHNCHSEVHAGVRELPVKYQTFDESFLDYNESVQVFDLCKCGSQKPVASKFCSHTCASTNRRKVDWDKVDLLSLMKSHTISELEDMLGVSNAAIYKRRDKILNTK